MYKTRSPCFIIYYYYGPGDAIARVSRSSMDALHTLLSCVLRPASCMWPPVVSDAVHCSLLCSCFSFFSFVFPSFWFHVIAVVCYFAVSFGLHPIQMSKVS